MNENEDNKNTNDELKKDEKPKSIGREILDYVVMIAIVIGIVFVVDHVLLINARIPSSSMEDTIMVGDRVFGNRLAYNDSNPKRYDIVIFKYPDDERQLFIKRIIGLPGDKVEIIDGKVYINDSKTPLRDDFCPEKPIGSYGPYKVPKNSYFVLGDNRNNSKDSRFWVTTNYVKKSAILGKAEFRYWPLNKMGKVS